MSVAEKVCVFVFLLQGVCCRYYSISLPEKIEALSGSCVIIKCTFEIEEDMDTELTERAAIGQWFRDGNGNNQVFHSRDPKPNHFQGNMIGKLHEKNCTTIFYNGNSNHSGRYYFRIESGNLKYTYKINLSTINVIDSPPKPTVRLYEEQKEVLEGISVNLRCSAETLCSSPPPTLTWSSTPRIPLDESSRQQELISDLNFTASQRHHRVTFTCTITYQLLHQNKTAQDNITLDVQYSPKISPSSSCNRTGVSVYVCEVDGNPFPELEWHLSGRPVTNSSNMFISEERLNSTGLRSSITLHQSRSHTSILECVGSNTRSTERKLFQLNLFSQEASWFNIYSFLIGGVVGAVIVILCVAILLYKSQRGDKTALNQTDEVVSLDNNGEPFYVNRGMMSSAGAATLGSS